MSLVLDKFRELDTKILNHIENIFYKRYQKLLDSPESLVPDSNVSGSSVNSPSSVKISPKKRKHKHKHKRKRKSKTVDLNPCDIQESAKISSIGFDNLINVNADDSIINKESSGINSIGFSNLINVSTGDNINNANNISNCNFSSSAQKPKIIVLGDSQSRGLAYSLNGNLDDKYELCVFSRPGAKFDDVTRDLKNIIDNNKLGDEDFLIILAGSNDICSTNMSPQRFFCLDNIKKCAKLTNIIVSEIPTRFDLPPKFDTVIDNCNSFLRTSFKNSSVHLLNLDNLRRIHFGRSGLHYSVSGRDVLSKKIKNLIHQITVFRMRI